MDDPLLKKVISFQQNEITEYRIYRTLSRFEKKPHNSELLKNISEDELRHYSVWKKYSGKDVRPKRLKMFIYYLYSKFFGVTFTVKLLEKGEEEAQEVYKAVSGEIYEALQVFREEEEHEKKLIDMIREERLDYVGSMVLGLNDALVELTGTLAGLTLALGNTKLIALTGMIMGIAASLSMGASEYLSTKAEESSQNPFKASIYTASAYIIAVVFLILPFIIFNGIFAALAATLAAAVAIIWVFNYYIAIAKDLDFKKRFAEMALISLGVAGVSFGIGFVLRNFLGVEV